MKKRLLALVIALAMMLSALTGCGSSGAGEDATVAELDPAAREDIVSYLTDGAFKCDDVAMTVNGQEISAAYYLYWVAYLMTSMESSGLTAEMLDNQITEDQTVVEYLQENGEIYSTNYSLIEQMAEEAGIALNEEEEAEAKSYAGNLDENMLMSYCATPEVLETYYRQNLLGNKLQESLYGEGGEKEPTEEDLKAYAAENYYTCRYILFPLTDGDGNEMDSEEQLENCKTVYEELKAVSAEELEETFQQYQEEYNTKEHGADGNTDRYTFSSGTVVPGFEDTISKLEDHQLGMTEDATSYGYFVIMRLPLEMDDTMLSEVKTAYPSVMFSGAVEDRAETAEVELSDAVKNLDVTAFCTKLFNLQSDIQAIQSAEAAKADSSAS